MSRNKAFRRHHFQRCLKAEFRKQWDGWYFRSEGHSDADRVKAWEFARRRVDNQKWCSCWMCSNNRKFYGNSKVPYTMQERRAAPYLKEQD